MEQFREPEVLGADDMWHCNKCQQFCQATKTLDVWRLPRVLLAHLKRFRFSRTFREKLPTLVRFPTKDLDLRTMELCPSDAADPPIYDLVAISVRRSLSLARGSRDSFADNWHSAWRWP